MRPVAVAVLGRGVVDPDTPILTADDAALARGLAAFETIRVYDGRIFALDRSGGDRHGASRCDGGRAESQRPDRGRARLRDL